MLTVGALLTIVGGAFEALAVATILPKTVDDLGGLHLYGWVFSAYMLANLIGIIVAGTEADVQGPGRSYLVGLILFGTGLLIAGFAPSMEVLILGRAVQGFGGGLFNSAIYVVVGRGYPESAKPRMLALMSSAWVMPGLIGPAFAGIVADAVGWRWVFLGLPPALLVALVLAYPRIRTIPAGTSERRDPRRYRDALVLAGGGTGLLAGLSASRIGLAVPLVIAGGAATIWGFRHLTPPGTLRAARGLPAAIAVMGLVNLGFFGVDAFVPLALIDIRGRSTAFAGIALTAATVSWSAGSWVQAHFADKRSRRWVVRAGLGLIGLGCAGTLLVLFDGTPIAAAPATWALAGLGMGLAYSGSSLTVLQTADPGTEGMATSAMQLSSILGTALGAGIGGAWIALLSDGQHANRSSLVVQDALMVGVLALAFLAAGRIPHLPGRTDRLPPRPEGVPGVGETAAVSAD